MSIGRNVISGGKLRKIKDFPQFKFTRIDYGNPDYAKTFFDVDITDETKTLRGNMSVYLKEGVIAHLWIHPNFRKKGLGNQLLAMAENVLRHKGFKKIKVAISGTTGTKEFYERQGFVETSKRYIGFDTMEKNL